MRIALLPYSPLLSIALFMIGYLALMLLVYLFQERLLYFPDASTVDLADSFGLRPWPSRENFRGFISSEAPRGLPRGNLLRPDALRGRDYAGRVFAEPCEAKNAIPPCGNLPAVLRPALQAGPQGFLAKKGEWNICTAPHKSRY